MVLGKRRWGWRIDVDEGVGGSFIAAPGTSADELKALLPGTEVPVLCSLHQGSLSKVPLRFKVWLESRTAPYRTVPPVPYRSTFLVVSRLE